jgi:GTP-binding protein HflX
MGMEKVYLISVHLKEMDIMEAEDSLKELGSLADTLGYEIVGEIMQTRSAPDNKTYVGSGKLEEIKEEIERLDTTIVFFDHELSPNQGKNLEKALDCMVWDRTQVILEIFSRHAQTNEARAQVELARLHYMLPRLVGMWSHLDREKGGTAVSRGMGEKQVNVDRNLVRKRIGILEKTLKKTAQERSTQRKQRANCFQIGLVGYTNAGKSTLMNLLTKADVYAENKLFATLESTTRVLKDLTKPEILLSDTVGFIRNLPHSLVASFRSTLDALKEADLLLHVVDASHPFMEQHIETTQEVLEEINVEKVPVVLVLNKMDQVDNKMDQLILNRHFPDAVQVSAFEPESGEVLRAKIKDFFINQFSPLHTIISYDRSDLIAFVYENSMVDSIEYKEDGIHVKHVLTDYNRIKFEALIQTNPV